MAAGALRDKHEAPTGRLPFRPVSDGAHIARQAMNELLY